MKKCFIRSVWPPVVWRGRSPRSIAFTRPWAGRLSWALRPGFLRNPGHRQRRLFAGPWVGEFGWELMNWQGYIRALRPFYEYITVCARSSSAALYNDCCDEFIQHDIQGQSNAHVVFDMKNPEELMRVLDLVPPNSDHLQPLKYIPEKAQKFIKFGQPLHGKRYPDVLIHARNKKTGGRQDWTEQEWSDFVGLLKTKSLSVGCIGLSSATFDIDGLFDYRDVPLEETASVMAAAKLVVGPSSGPMHLAALCGTPHLVWTDKRTYGMRKTSRQKYQEWWNPLNTKVDVIDEFGFRPPVPLVFNAIEELFRDGSLWR